MADLAVPQFKEMHMDLWRSLNFQEAEEQLLVEVEDMVEELL